MVDIPNWEPNRILKVSGSNLSFCRWREGASENLGVSPRLKDEWRAETRQMRPLIFLNTEHLNHMFGSIRESSGKHQPFHFYFQRELWVLDGGGAWGRGGWA